MQTRNNPLSKKCPILVQPAIESSVLTEYVHKHKPIRQAGESLYTHPIYTIPQAAQSLAIEPWTLHSWYSDRHPILKPSGWYGDQEVFALLSFRDVEEAYKIHLLRTKYGYSMQYLRDALVRARQESKSDHPLIDNTIIVFDELVIVKPARGRRRKQAMSLGPVQKPLYIQEVLDVWGKRIIVEKDEWRIYPWRNAAEDDASRPVTLDPDVLSGRLVVTGTRIPVVVLRNRRLSGETVDDIAQDYGIEADRV